MHQLEKISKRIHTARNLDKILIQLAYYRDYRDRMIPQKRLVIWEDNSVQNT